MELKQVGDPSPPRKQKADERRTSGRSRRGCKVLLERGHCALGNRAVMPDGRRVARWLAHEANQDKYDLSPVDLGPVDLTAAPEMNR
jgi:hypothetical protein